MKKKILEANATTRDGISEEITTDDIAYMKFGSMISVDAERSHSLYEMTLTINRKSF